MTRASNNHHRHLRQPREHRDDNTVVSKPKDVPASLPALITSRRAGTTPSKFEPVFTYEDAILLPPHVTLAEARDVLLGGGDRKFAILGLNPYVKQSTAEFIDELPWEDPCGADGGQGNVIGDDAAKFCYKETIPIMGPITKTITVDVVEAVSPEDPNEMWHESVSNGVWVRKLTRLSVVCDGDGDVAKAPRVRMWERLDCCCGRVVAGIVERKAKEAHQRLFSRIPKLFSGTVADG